jgi:glycosyltransferase involved in cell wall biosynthesis
VNDGSTDRSSDILRTYARRDTRIALIESAENEGLAAARNAGISAARGEWLAFVDSDDIADQELAAKAMARAKSSTADLVLYDYAVFRREAQLQAERSVPSRLLGVDPADTHALLSLNAYAWTKVVRAAHFRRLGLAFPVGLTYEDVPVHWELVTRTERIALLPERLYFYRQRAGSIGVRTDLSRADFARVYDLVYDSLSARSLLERFGELFMRQRLRSFQILHDSIAEVHRPAVRSMVLSRMDDQHWRVVRNDPGLDRDARDFHLALRGHWGARARRAVWRAARAMSHTLRRYQRSRADCD